MQSNEIWYKSRCRCQIWTTWVFIDLGSTNTFIFNLSSSPPHRNHSKKLLGMTGPQWAPAEVLHLDPYSFGFTCIGYAKTQGRRCRNHIADANLQESAKLLLEMSRIDPYSQRLDSELEELASRLLCRRWHQVQAGEIKRQWHRHIENHQAAEARRLARSIIVQAASAPARYTLARTQTMSRGRDPPAAAMIPLPARGSSSSSSAIPSMTVREESGGRENNESSEEASRRQTNSKLDTSSQQEASSQRTANHHSNNPSLPSSPGERMAHTPTAPIQEHHSTTREEEGQAQEATSEEVEIASEAEPSQHIPTPVQEPQHEGSNLVHHDRRAIEGECPICTEDFSSGDNTVWCRAQCRQNIHAGCMDSWRLVLIGK